MSTFIPNGPIMGANPMPNNGFMPGNTYVGYVPQTAGLNFAQPIKPAGNNLTQDEYALVTECAGSDFTLTDKERAAGMWNFRDNNGRLCLKIVDASTNLVEAEHTHEKFHLINTSKDAVEAAVNLVSDVVDTIKVTIGDKISPEILRDATISQAFNKKVIPKLYEKAMENYNNVIGQLQQQVNGVGYVGGNNNMLYGGGVYGVPNYVMSDATAPMMNQPVMAQPMMNQFGQPMMAQPMMNQFGQPVMAQPMMGVPTMPVGGTMMGGGNPFVQGGQPQQIQQFAAPAPMQFGQPSVPFAGTPQMATPQMTQPQAPAPQAPQTPNPGIGAPVTPAPTAPATTAKTIV